MTFNDRVHAGRELAKKLSAYAHRDDVIVLSLPMGGVIVGEEIARVLDCPFDVIISRMVPFPGQPDLAIAVVSETGTVVKNCQLVSTYKISRAYLEREISRQRKEIEWRRALYRGGRQLPPLCEKVVILTDDGLLTGSIMKSVIQILMRDGVKQLVAAVAVAERETERGIRSMVDELVCLNPQNNLFTVKSHYHSFPRVSDEEIMRILSNNEEFLVCREGDIDMINDELVEFFGYMSREAQIP